MAVTDDGTANGKLLGIIGSRDYRVSRMSADVPVTDFMTPFEKLVTAPEGTTLKEANDIIWDNKLNALPLIDKNQHLKFMVFRKDYDLSLIHILMTSRSTTISTVCLRFFSSVISSSRSYRLPSTRTRA